MNKFETFVEEVKVTGHDLLGKVSQLIEEGNIRRVIIKDQRGNTFVEIPVTIAALGVIAAPVLAAVGALSALVANFTLVVERSRASQERPPETAQTSAKEVDKPM